MFKHLIKIAVAELLEVKEKNNDVYKEFFPNMLFDIR